MKFLAWIDFPSMSIGISKLNDGFKCVKFVEGSIVRGASKEVSGLIELRAFLMTLPGAESKKIEQALIELI